MAIPVTPTLRVVLSGSNITDFDTSVTWTLGQKTEGIYSLKDTDGDVSIDVTNIDDVEAIVFYSTGAFNIKFDSFEIAVSAGFFVLNTTQTWLDTITTVAINTASTTDIDVEVKIYGNDA